jgi:ketosteroid isomerase-like protein
MHRNAEILSRLFTALDAHDHVAMASCYCEDAHFRDIAFDLHGRERIHAMWRMVCGGDIRASFEILEADDKGGRVRLVDDYTFGASTNPPKAGRPVHNVIDSDFVFRQQHILRQEDHCDPKAWAQAAIGTGFRGFVAGHFRFARNREANKLLAASIEAHRI